MDCGKKSSKSQSILEDVDFFENGENTYRFKQKRIPKEGALMRALVFMELYHTLHLLFLFLFFFFFFSAEIVIELSRRFAACAI